MSNPQTTIIGNLTADPELRFTPSGDAVANFTVATNDRKFNRDTNEWVDGDTSFWRCAIWKQAAEAAAEQLHKGVSVIVTGKVKQRSYEDRDGNQRTSVEVDVDAVGIDIGAMARRRGGGTPRPQGGSQRPQQAAADPWASQPAQAKQGEDPWAQNTKSAYSEPPF